MLTLKQVEELCKKHIGEPFKVIESEYTFNVEANGILKFWIRKDGFTPTLQALRNLNNEIEEIFDKEEVSKEATFDNPNNNPQLKG